MQKDFRPWEEQDELHEEHLDAALDKASLPRHVAVIMDGNGRWAARRGLPRAAGHRAGAEALRGIVRKTAALGIPYLTAYAFSTENWKRPADEVSELWRLLTEYISSEIDELNSNGVRLLPIGRLEELPAPAYSALQAGVERTRGNDRLNLILAINYGGRRELTDAVRAIARRVQAGELQVEAIDEKVVADHLYTRGVPDPDLLIRPAGEFRVSNFLLWQMAYTEFWVSPVLWPDFKPAHLLQALIDFQQRERRFGGR
ncbi:MAG: isoprenyl transferase [Desulfotomaculales bacterium]